MTIDSAEGALRNQYFKDYGERWHPVAKKKNQTMIDMVISLLGWGAFLLSLTFLANRVFVEEHKMYRYDDKSLNTDDPKVIKEDDHTVDEFKYFVLDNARELRLKAKELMMGIVQTIKNFFTRSKYVMTAQNLTNITDHPKNSCVIHRIWSH